MTTNSRPSKNQPAPAPQSGTTHCLDCGRVMPHGSRPSSTTPRKYCSATCRSRSKERWRAPERVCLAEAFHRALTDPGWAAELRSATTLRGKGKVKDMEGVVFCSEVEEAVYRRSKTPQEFASEGGGEGRGEDEDEGRGQGSANGDTENHSDGGNAEEEDIAAPPDAREEARRAARRLINFGWSSQGVSGEHKEVEAVQAGRIVEASYAKGEWGLRWSSDRR